MENYKIQIIKLSEKKDPNENIRLGQISTYDNVIFDALMQSDDAIEILQHLYHLKDKNRAEMNKS